MTSSRALALVLVFATSAFAAGLSVEDTVRLALQRNTDLTAARQRVEQARARLAQARAALAPAIGFDAGYLRGDAPSAYLFKRIDARQLPAAVNFNAPGLFQNVEVGVSLRYTLWDAGRSNLTVASARDAAAADGFTRDAVANEIIGTVIPAYYDVLAAREFVEVAERSATTVDEELRETRVRQKLGGALRTDVLSLEVRAARAREATITARNGVELAKTALRRLLDMGPDDDLELSGHEWRPAELPATLAERLEAAREHRPELRVVERHLAAARSGRTLADRQFKPRFDVMGRYYADDDSGGFEADRANWTVAAVMTWDIADGGRRSAGRNEAEAAVQELEARRRSLVRAVELQVHQAHLELEEAAARLDVAQANGERAEETLALVKARYEGGSMTVTGYLQAETDRTESQVRAIRARYDVKKSTAALGHVLGLCLRCAKGWDER